ncbi:MAG: arylsulfatase [Lentisphaeraceae bacterium]|nr:arylsulfatase [Lentisphaeraceae bacterium]
MKFIILNILFICSCLNALEKPNVIIIYADDVGYGDIHSQGAKLIPTPHIDKLAQEGLRFTDAHSSSSVCTPSRYSLLTGEYSFRNKRAKILEGTANALINETYFTMPRMFRNSGYKTAIVGKWHLGLGDGEIDWNKEVTPGPYEVGFDESFIIPATGDRVPCVYMKNNLVLGLDKEDPIEVSYKEKLRGYPIGTETPAAMTLYGADDQHAGSVINGVGRIGWMKGGQKALWNDEEMADRLVDESQKFIAKNHKDSFFLVFSAHDIHVPRIPHSRFRGVSKHGYRGDAMVQLDWCVGQLYKKCRDLGILENTIFIFSSDNGPVYDDGYKDGTKVWKFSENVEAGHAASGPFNGGKYSLYEGGTRVPFIVNWKSTIKPGVSDALVSQLDLIASFAKMLDVNVPSKDARDSIDMWAVFTGDSSQGREYLIEQAVEGLSLRHNNWKYIPAANYKRTMNTAGKAMLFNLDEDPGETKNLADVEPSKVIEMKRDLERLSKQ